MAKRRSVWVVELKLKKNWVPLHLMSTKKRGREWIGEQCKRLGNPESWYRVVRYDASKD